MSICHPYCEYVRYMKNIQIIDDAVNATFSIFQATDSEFQAIFPAPGQDIELIDDFVARMGEEARRYLDPLWDRPIHKSYAQGIHGTLIYGSKSRSFIPSSKREVDRPSGDINAAQRALYNAIRAANTHEKDWRFSSGSIHHPSPLAYPRNAGLTRLLVGEPTLFAIESQITERLESAGQRALGFFVIYLRDRLFGLRQPDATSLACSFDEVERRIARRGTHSAPELFHLSPQVIAEAFRKAFYGDPSRPQIPLPLSGSSLRALITSRHITWAPDGDEAFDDGSYVLQLESETEVRLIAFCGDSSATLYDPATLSDVRMPSDAFYRVLAQWRAWFQAATAED